MNPNPPNSLIQYHIQDSVGVMTIVNPPVNALGPGIPQGIMYWLEQGLADPNVTAFVLIGSGRTFVAGADIKQFVLIARGMTDFDGSIETMLTAMEQSSKPIICAIHGTALGGGLEMAMACHYRVAVPSALVGQPEVKLGLIPGAGGTQRLPRLVGMQLAASMCTLGDPIPATQAQEAGLIDALVEGDLLTSAIQFAKLKASLPIPRACDRSDRLDAANDSQTLQKALDQTLPRSPSPMAAKHTIEAMKAIHQGDFAFGIRKEAELFREVLYSDQSKGLVHAFLAEREVAKIPFLKPGTDTQAITSAAVVGAGTMGGGIAMNYANAGIPVFLKEADQATLQRGLDRIRSNYQASVDKGKLSQSKMDERMKLIRPTLDYQDFAQADIIVEAVFEGMELKKKVFVELDQIAKPDAILATNTSTLSIDEIASVTRRPTQVIGHHFFSPANVMKLLEIVRGKATSDSVIATSMSLAKKLNKVGVLVGNCRGFVGNRMFDPYIREAQFLVEEGASVAHVDQALSQFGMAMGPLAVCDLAGLDVCWRIRNEYKDDYPAGWRDVLALDTLYEQGRYGQKTGAGWYRYEGRQAIPDPTIESMIDKLATEKGIRRRQVPTDEIVDRCIYILINEGARILQDKMALRSLDIDIIYLYGYGFPPFRGGPMYYADTIGLEKVLNRVREFEQQHGEMWSPAPLLVELAQSGKKFADFT